jgi:hypothetical protein
MIDIALMPRSQSQNLINGDLSYSERPEAVSLWQSVIRFVCDVYIFQELSIFIGKHAMWITEVFKLKKPFAITTARVYCYVWANPTQKLTVEQGQPLFCDIPLSESRSSRRNSNFHVSSPTWFRSRLISDSILGAEAQSNAALLQDKKKQPKKGTYPR